MFIGKTNIALHEATNTSITHINTNLSLIRKDCFFLDAMLIFQEIYGNCLSK